nr:beta-1,6-N-acetylglucosaminyltransferase [Leeuwenhoekiella sp. ZYFB001]
MTRLTSTDSYFFIHIDQRVPDAAFRNVFKGFNNVYFFENDLRCNGIWGGFGIVQATVNLIYYALSKVSDSFLVLLSGQDYPLQSQGQIQQFFNKTSFQAFIFGKPMPTTFWQNGGLERIKKYRFYLSNTRYDFVLIPSIWNKSFYRKKVLKDLYAILLRGNKKDLLKIFKTRKHPANIKAYGGSQWWAMSSNLAQRILDFIDNRPSFLNYHQDTLLADEIFFQTLIHHIAKTDNTLKIAPSLTYTNWERKNVPLPVTFSAEDFMELKNASETHLFARKFDIEKDTIILDKIDTELLL